ncbi:glycosyl hydrolase family 8 [Algibacter sp. L1A34]|uniref:glycosyl hydrolase family 8 n=1 Tax=Algibacter sp. L1A34 TaxID=2686365 RepID=UPI00131D097A|nr:glycosyl hydrolase family 8 [Algibacter sp. L1A34]
MKNNYLVLFCFTFVVSLSSNSQISQISFLNANYSYGIQPENIQSTDIYNVYVAWRNAFAEPCTNGRYRIKFDTPSETVSEGIGYGMLLSAYANDRELFDGLWLYYKDFSNSNGVMNWKINECTSVIESNGASDAELDAAYALIVADKHWGSSGTINYKDDALTLISAIKTHEVESGTYVLKPGDAWGGTSNTNISYLSPGYFRVFGIYSNDTVFWNAVTDKSYDILNANLSINNASYNLVSDWCKADGTYSNEVSWADYEGKTYAYNAARTPWRIALDYIWFGDLQAINYTNLCNGFVNAQGGFNQIFPGYSQAGVAMNTEYRDPTFTGAYASAAMSSTSQNFVDSGYSELKTQTTDAYFGSTLRAIYMFALSGNMYNALSETVLSNISETQKTFKLYPNPVLDNLNILFKTSKLRTINVYTINGELLLSNEVNTLQVKIDLSQFNSGLYFLNIDRENFKIIKS